ncbi:hypothetical protein PR048_004609 [Dryococelus australis]|uniref:Uncharacterized protein n=1 Tax=Dryococelus australis TaxID=614101 RepID=A0ABQ9I6B6_9NEOP|nr:hypothetical protein PR048_004609 [Dryococelus australis]
MSKLSTSRGQSIGPPPLCGAGGSGFESQCSHYREQPLRVLMVNRALAVERGPCRARERMCCAPSRASKSPARRRALPEDERELRRSRLCRVTCPRPLLSTSVAVVAATIVRSRLLPTFLKVLLLRFMQTKLNRYGFCRHLAKNGASCGSRQREITVSDMPKICCRAALLSFNYRPFRDGLHTSEHEGTRVPRRQPSSLYVRCRRGRWTHVVLAPVGRQAQSPPATEAGQLGGPTHATPLLAAAIQFASSARLYLHLRSFHTCFFTASPANRSASRLSDTPAQNNTTRCSPLALLFRNNTQGATVAERLACPPLTRVDPGSIPGRATLDPRMWESCRTMPLVGGSSRESPVSPSPSFRRRSALASITRIGSQDISLKSRPNLFLIDSLFTRRLKDCFPYFQTMPANGESQFRFGKCYVRPPTSGVIGSSVMQRTWPFTTSTSRSPAAEPYEKFVQAEPPFSSGTSSSSKQQQRPLRQRNRDLSKHSCMTPLTLTYVQRQHRASGARYQKDTYLHRWNTKTAMLLDVLDLLVTSTLKSQRKTPKYRVLNYDRDNGSCNRPANRQFCISALRASVASRNILATRERVRRNNGRKQQRSEAVVLFRSQSARPHSTIIQVSGRMGSYIRSCKCQTVSPNFVIIGFSGSPPTMVANLKTHSRQKGNAGIRMCLMCTDVCISELGRSFDPDPLRKKINTVAVAAAAAAAAADSTVDVLTCEKTSAVPCQHMD